MRADFQWPLGLDPFTVDVEWAAEEVLADLRRLFNQYGVRATFFVTHAGVETPGHERGLHPNFRQNGDSYKQVRQRTARSVAPRSIGIVADPRLRAQAAAWRAAGRPVHLRLAPSSPVFFFATLGIIR
jgi:peptidoglycan/xylan/chitin deacetylase (PgdA/CDA1 family)